MRSIAIRIDKRFEDAYWEPPEEPDPETIHSDLEPLIQELEELITDPPDHEDVEPTLHFAEDLRQECVCVSKRIQTISKRSNTGVKSTWSA